MTENEILMQENEPTYLQLNGIPLQSPSSVEAIHFYRDPQGAWLPSRDNLSNDIDFECISLGDAFAIRVFGNANAYYSTIETTPLSLIQAGQDSESPVSSLGFATIMRDQPDGSAILKLMYVQDCRHLITCIQECVKEVLYLQGEFYRALNLDILFFPPTKDPDGLRWISSPTVTSIHATLGFIFIRLHSLLDYVTRLAFEVEHFRSAIGRYEHLASRGIQFGGRNKLALNNTANSLFERCELLIEVELLRNRIIHEGFFDDLPKVYKHVQKGATVEKFILFPDRGREGQFERVKARCLFFSREDKINLRLPAMISEFQSRLLKTLKLIKNAFSAVIEG